jgi:hypothetical protein
MSEPLGAFKAVQFCRATGFSLARRGSHHLDFLHGIFAMIGCASETLCPLGLARVNSIRAAPQQLSFWTATTNGSSVHNLRTIAQLLPRVDLTSEEFYA